MTQQQVAILIGTLLLIIVILGIAVVALSAMVTP